MFDNETIVADEADHIPDDEDATLRHNASEAHVCPKDTRNPTWVYFGKCAMPDSEHLIPFRT